MSSGKASTAAEWMAKLRSERVTPRDHEAFGAWLDARAEHRAAAASLRHIWRAVGRLQGDPAVRRVLDRHLGPARR
ncbi:MAG: DUF4880 domain-containing protein [Acidobacteriota bacterium]